MINVNKTFNSKHRKKVNNFQPIKINNFQPISKVTAVNERQFVNAKIIL